MKAVRHGPAVPSEAWGSAALVAAAFLWGSTFLIVQDTIEEVAVVPFLAVRFLVAAAFLWPLARRRPATPGELRHGVAAGVCLLVGYLAQTVGLQHTTSSASAFITYLLVVIVPVMSAVLTRTMPTWSVAVGVVLAVAGLTLLSGGPERFGRGEVLTLGCAFCFALHIMVLGRTSARHDAIRLTVWQVATVGVACLFPGFGLGGYGFSPSAWLAAAFCGVAATAMALCCMVWAQQVVTEARAALILLLEPVFAAVLGYATGERLGLAGAAGGGLILVAVLVTDLLPQARGRLEVRPRAQR